MLLLGQTRSGTIRRVLGTTKQNYNFKLTSIQSFIIKYLYLIYRSILLTIKNSLRKNSYIKFAKFELGQNKTVTITIFFIAVDY